MLDQTKSLALLQPSASPVRRFQKIHKGDRKVNTLPPLPLSDRYSYSPKHRLKRDAIDHLVQPPHNARIIAKESLANDQPTSA